MSVAESLTLPDLVLSSLWLLKTDIGYKTFLAHNMTLFNSATFIFWVTLQFSRRHGKQKSKRFDFWIEYKPIDRICPLRYH